jgi:plasmid stability protein
MAPKWRHGSILEAIMGVNLSIKGVPDALAERLRARAQRHHRSLQGELMAIIEQAAADGAGEAPASTATLPGVRRSWTQGHKTVEQLLAERQGTGWWSHRSLAAAPLAVDIVRADRDAR